MIKFKKYTIKKIYDTYIRCKEREPGRRYPVGHYLNHETIGKDFDIHKTTVAQIQNKVIYGQLTDLIDNGYTVKQIEEMDRNNILGYW